MVMESKNALAVFGDSDYLLLETFSLLLKQEGMDESGGASLCFWLYLLKSSNPGTIIRQGRADGSASSPLLTLNSDRKLVLHPLRSEEDWKSDVQLREDEVVISDQPCLMEKWVHVGLEIGSPVLRLHLTSTGVYARRLSKPEVAEGIARKEAILLSGGPFQAGENPLTQGFVYFARLLPPPDVTNHYVKNPPLELALDGSSAASDDYEMEEGGDGVWSVVGGKASCRRNFALDVVLLDALGRSVHKDMELVAFLVFTDTGLPVEKLKDDAEAPLLTTFDGVEFPSSERPIKLVHGRASFKLKISQLSSKCDNRLFRVCFDSPNTPKYPFLRVLSRPIRCVSRNRNHRVPAHTHWKQSHAPVVSQDCIIPSRSADESMTAETFQTIKDSRCSDAMTAPPDQKDSFNVPGQHLLKRARTRQHKEVPMIVVNSNTLVQSCPIDNRQVQHASEDSLSGLSSVVLVQRPQALPATPIGGLVAYPGAAFPVISTRAFFQTDPGGRFESGARPDLSPDGSNVTAAASNGIDGGTTHSQGWNASLMDHLVFKYCLENMRGRSEFLKSFVINTGDQELTEFAARVSQVTGCRHNGYQILIARGLLFTSNEIWSKVSQESSPPLWVNVMRHVDQNFKAMSGCPNRSLSAQDTHFLKKIVGCGDFVSREEFTRLWNWIYPVALALRSSQLRRTWDSVDPRWIEGMVTKEEVERLLRESGDKKTPKPGTFLLRFASSRRWPHPDSGALVVSYVGTDRDIYHKLLSLDENPGFDDGKTLLSEQLLSQPELKQLCKIPPGSTGTGRGPSQEYSVAHHPLSANS